MSSNLIPWSILRYDTEKAKAFSTTVKDHPLKNIVVTERIPRRILGSAPSTGRTTPVSITSNISEPLATALKQLDPLTEFAMHEEMDPLSKMVAEMDIVDNTQPTTSLKKEDKVNKTDLWSHRKTAILQKYTTSEKLTMVTSFLLEGEKVVVKAQSTAVDKVQHRLEQLDNFEEGSQRKLDLSQTEYISRIEQLNKELISAWNTEQRVKALKIAIQCAKMLTDTDVLTFYPSKFVLITDILDCFGKLVYERLRTKAEYYKPGSQVPTALPEDFTPDMVPKTARETCLNWFFKIASIRELVPRLYIEMALLKSYYFLSSTDCPDALTKITEMIHGIGNPLVAVYARCYLCRAGMNVATKCIDTNYLRRNFECFLESYQHIFSQGVKDQLHQQKMTVPMYVTLYTPALDYIMEVITLYSLDTALTDLLSKCKKYSNSSLILNTIMSGFKPAYISERCLQFLSMIGQCTDDGISLASLLRTLGLCVTVCPPPREQRPQVLNSVILNMSLLTEPADYASCFEVWIQFVAKYFSAKEVDSLLGDLLSHMHKSEADYDCSAQLQNIIERIVADISDIESFLTMETFFPVMELFREKSRQVEVSKMILVKFNSMIEETNDPMVANVLIYLGTILHNSVNQLSPDDEKRQIGEILCKLLRKVNYRLDLERQLNFLVEARSCFRNMDVVLVQAIQSVINIAGNMRRVMKRLQKRKVPDFLQACVAYCFITIPSIGSPKTRLELYLLSGQVALYSTCLGQANATFRAIIKIIRELPAGPETESFLLSFVRKFLSLLLVVPDNPERGVRSLLKSLLNALRNFKWQDNSYVLGVIYIHVIDLLSVAGQEMYPYRIEKVEANDSLWGSDPKFTREITRITAIVIGDVCSILRNLGPGQKQYQIALDLFIRIAIRSDLSNEELNTLAVKLWNLCLKTDQADLKYMMTTRSYLQGKAQHSSNVALEQLTEKLSLPTD
ncbi:hypothetical protein GWI33_013750 [Rhynchophorus ferrugineus]|uniref:Uncharacterized protein n=1 Tax=Rhynchophorus ferrugineus TaxID=354439 RepID=A0A834M7J1_RHYFE|nr:hypothetical protein GWI33_013750 [Rhynchophorus ferrugineus]